MEISEKRYRQIKKAAKFCFQVFHSRDPFFILDRLDIKCSFLTLKGNLAGFTNKATEHSAPQVYISNKYDDQSQKIICCHELGHILIHNKDDLNMFDEKADGISARKDYEANLFVLELMPKYRPMGKNYLEYTSDELQTYMLSKLCS